MPADEQSLGEEIIGRIETNCRTPEGALVGQPIRLMNWQKDAFRKIYDNSHGTRRCIISVGDIADGTINPDMCREKSMSILRTLRSALMTRLP
jgi:hypothetical protein